MKSMKGNKENKENGFLRIVWEFANSRLVSGIFGALTVWLISSIDLPTYPVLLGIVKIVLTLGMFIFSVCLIMAFINEIRRHRVLTPEEKFHLMLPELRKLRDVYGANPKMQSPKVNTPLTAEEYDAFARLQQLVLTLRIPFFDVSIMKRGRKAIPYIIHYLDALIRCAEKKDLTLAYFLAKNSDPSSY